MGWVTLLVVVVVVVVLLLRRLGGKPDIGRGSTDDPSSGPRRLLAKDKVFDMKWYGAGAEIQVAGLQLREPNVYISRVGNASTVRASDPSEIILELEVRRPQSVLADMEYWPWYARLSPEHRHEYLRWIASGRQALPPAEGYLFLYYYGLERRLLVDQQDHTRILQEVIRLLQVDRPRRGTRDGGSFRRYATGLLWFEIARAPSAADEKIVDLAFEFTESWTLDLFASPLAWLAHHRRPLPAAWAQRIAQLHPRSTQSVVTKRVPAEFSALFTRRFKEEFGAGLQLKVSKRARRFTYRPASAGLNEVSCTIADPTGIPSQFEPLADIWNSCVDDLRKLSKVTDGRDAQPTVEEWEAMPADLRSGVDHPLTRDVQAIVTRHTVDCRSCLVPAGTFASLLRIEQRPKLTAAQARRTAEVLEYICYGVEPDPRLGGGAYEWNERVSVFLRLDDSPVDKGRYSAAAIMLRLGLSVAEADGRVDEEELRQLTEQIESAFQLPDHERRRLEALRALLLSEGADAASVGRKVEQLLSVAQRRTVGRLLVAIAASDSVIDKKELAALRKCFRLLGLGPEVLEQTLAELSPETDDHMVTVAAASGPREPGEPLPQRGEVGLRLNREAISSIMAETREVARLLADAMAVSDDGSEAGTVAVAVQTQTITLTEARSSIEVDSGPAGRYSSFYKELISRDCWPAIEAQEMARRHGVMLAGAVEAINDWAFDALGGPILEESSEALLVDRSLL